MNACGSYGCNPTTGRCFGDASSVTSPVCGVSSSTTQPSGTSACSVGTASGFKTTSTGWSWDCSVSGVPSITCSATKTTTSSSIYYYYSNKTCVSTNVYSSITACNAEHSPCYTSPITCASANSCKTLGGNCKTTCLSTEVSDSNGSGQCSPAKCCVSVKSTVYCGTSSGGTVSSIPSGTAACKSGSSFSPVDSTASDGTYDWACINGTVRSLCSANKTGSGGTVYCGTSSGGTVSSIPSGTAACKSGSSFSPVDSTASDGTYDWACINGTVRSLCSANKKCVSSTDLPKCSDDSKSLMTCNVSGTWDTESCSHGCSNGACKTYYNPDGGGPEIVVTPTGIGETGVGGTKLSFKIAFMGVKPNPSCLDNFKTVAITVGKVGTTLSQDLSVPVTATSETNSSGYGIFKAENVTLGTGFSGVSNIYVKIKGSVHSKMYYCASGQSAKNTSQTCTVATDGTMNNFYDYPMLAGDVDQNGIVNVLDFGLIRNSMFVSGCSKGDLNGDGVVNDFDIKLYKVALEAKYDE